ncbi:hypothetical protein HYDPIDRAFT_29140 [Hydnomerulius pinastri MD-312]|uniref:Peptidyl-prolyl cis-trans isomerase n=1 Tax=Hydnomerulius pinastri MD-312 TaxID=994086 RepID=A0A0C9VZD4_9AGAM|nr:hypothetical protein HYDPIDRAFT_29140 [Hydnomerulius pinastri MD-312]
MVAREVYLDIYMGDVTERARAEASYNHTSELLSKYAVSYALPFNPEELSEEQREILRGIDKSKVELLFESPAPLLAGRLIFELTEGLARTTTNFRALCTGEKGKCKNARNKDLHYLNTPIHRIARGFIAQGGDIVKGDGNGGESIYGGDFKIESEGLKAEPHKGSLGMASASTGKNAKNTSQFFVVLTDDETQLKKLKGRYVFFGRLKQEPKEGWELLDRLSEAGGTDEKPSVPVWVGGCGICQ